MAYKWFDIFKCLDTYIMSANTAGGIIKSTIMQNQQLAWESHKSIAEKFKRCKVNPSFRDSTYGVNLTHLHLIIKYNKRIQFLLYVVDVFSKYSYLAPFKKRSYYNNYCFSNHFR